MREITNTIYKHDIDPIFLDEFNHVLTLSCKKRLLRPLNGGLVPTSNHSNITDNLDGLTAEVVGEDIHLKRGDVTASVLIKSNQGAEYVYYNNPDKDKATIIELWSKTDITVGLSTINLGLSITELTDDNGNVGYKFSHAPTLLNGIPWLEAPKNREFVWAKANWAMTNADNGSQRDNVEWLASTGFNERGHDVEEVIISRHADFPGLDYEFTKADAEDADKEHLIVWYMHGADHSGKGSFGVMIIDLKEYALKLYE